MNPSFVFHSFRLPVIRLLEGSSSCRTCHPLAYAWPSAQWFLYPILTLLFETGKWKDMYGSNGCALIVFSSTFVYLLLSFLGRYFTIMCPFDLISVAKKKMYDRR